ncbi:MAG: ROK family transcriptional regulator [Eubacteriales bacterium]|nr:ROK family transcriptional regulator [Eubacteriales bacterium]
MDTFSLTDIKKKNLSDVYHYIYKNPGCSKQAIANALAISLPTVSQHLTTLMNENLIEKSGQLSSSVGRRAMAYQIIPTARIAVGIEILAKNVYITALNLYGKKEAKEKFRLNFQPNRIYFEELQKTVKGFLQKYSYKEEQILGIGLGMQGLASPDGSQITYGKILDCTGLSIQMFADYFSVPCKFIHDAECASTSELWENPEINDAIYLSLGQHLGGAIIINGEFQNGLTGKSGTFEHMTLIPNGLECYCGKKGCAECYCSGHFLMESDMELDEFFAKKEQGDPSCQKKWDDYLQNLSILINNLHMVIENIVILGGNITPYFTEQDITVIKQNVLKRSTFQDDVSYIIQGRCRSDAVSIGAALPFIKEFLKDFALRS